jgi:hypothetical protein
MSRYRLAVALLLVGGLTWAETPWRSGPQPKDEILTAFRPLNINGEFANEPHCLVCEHGLNPVVMIFARDLSEPLVKLITQLDAETDKHRQQGLGAFVVFLKDSEAFRTELGQLAKAKHLKHTILSIEDPAVLEDYKLAKDADVTAVLYTRSVVHANHAWKRGTLNDRATAAILADIAKILPKK